MVLTASFVISSAIGLFCRRHQWKCFRQFNASVEASGPHDFSVRTDAPRLRATVRPSHPAPNVRDDREAPLLRSAGWLESVMLCLAISEAKYFCRKGWTQARHGAWRALICPPGNLVMLNSGAARSRINIRCKT
jgi:hypothetical protein